MLLYKLVICQVKVCILLPLVWHYSPMRAFASSMDHFQPPLLSSNQIFCTNNSWVWVYFPLIDNWRYCLILPSNILQIRALDNFLQCFSHLIAHHVISYTSSLITRLTMKTVSINYLGRKGWGYYSTFVVFKSSLYKTPNFLQN